MELSGLWDKYRSQILGGLGGAGLGAAALGGATALGDHGDDPAKHESNMRRNLMLGAALGGGAGVGGGAAYDWANSPEGGSTAIGGFLSRLAGSKSLMGAGAMHGAHAGLKQLTNPSSESHSLVGKLSGGTSWKDMEAKLNDKVTMGITPNMHGHAAITEPKFQDELRGLVNQATGNQGLLGRWSQNPVARTLGLNTSSHEHDVAGALMRLRGQLNMPYKGTGDVPSYTHANGDQILDNILGNGTHGGPGQGGLPYLRQHLTDAGQNPGKMSPISRSHVTSALSRTALGALVGKGIGSLNRMTGPSE